MEIVNSDATLHNVHTFMPGQEERTLFNIAQPVKGFKYPVKSQQFQTPGMYPATCDAGHPWMSAYIVVAGHPYYAVTDADGRFTLTNVPPGTYRLKMWHEGVAVTRTAMERGKAKAYTFEAPYEEVQEVTVGPSGNVMVDFSLVLREGAVTER
jgi:hypothetical protein